MVCSDIFITVTYICIFVKFIADKSVINTETFQYLTLEDICILIPEEYLSLRAKFRQKLFEWRKEKVFNDVYFKFCLLYCAFIIGIYASTS